MSQKYNTDWDIDQYYDETEPEQHWELRREFMKVHKEKFPEDYLVALARTFTNIEFMGCRYYTLFITLLLVLYRYIMTKSCYVIA